MRSANRSLPTPVSPTTSTGSLPIAIRAADCSSAASWRGLGRGLAPRAGAGLDHHRDRAEQERDADRQRASAGSAASLAPSTVVPFELPTSSISTSRAEHEVRVVARHRAGVDHDVALARAPDRQRAGAGERHDLERRPIDHEQDAIAERRLAIDLFGRGAGFVLDHPGSVREGRRRRQLIGIRTVHGCGLEPAADRRAAARGSSMSRRMAATGPGLARDVDQPEPLARRPRAGPRRRTPRRTRRGGTRSSTPGCRRSRAPTPSACRGWCARRGRRRRRASRPRRATRPARTAASSVTGRRVEDHRRAAR